MDYPEPIAKRNFETITCEQVDSVCLVTLNRPEVYNAFNSTMQCELRVLWRTLRYDNSVRGVVITGAGDRAFCTGIDRSEIVQDDSPSQQGTADPLMSALGNRINVGQAGETPFMFDDPGESLGPKSCGLFKPVIAAVNGIACGGAFYILGEVDFIVASDDATFFDPHVTYGMTAAFEPMLMLSKMPFGELVRMSLMGVAERVSAKRAHEIGLVSEVVGKDTVVSRSMDLAQMIASNPPLAVQGTLRAIWAARELSPSQAVALGYAFVGLGTSPDSIMQGQESFQNKNRPKWTLR